MGKSLFSKWCCGGELDSLIQKNEARTLSYTICKNKLKID